MKCNPTNKKTMALLIFIFVLKFNYLLYIRYQCNHCGQKRVKVTSNTCYSGPVQGLSVHQPMETTHCFCICLIAHTYNTIHTYNLNQVQVEALMALTCSFMCTNHIDMITHTPAFLDFPKGNVLCEARHSDVLTNFCSKCVNCLF